MPIYLIKQKGLPPTWGRFSENRLEVSFTLRPRATEFASPEMALNAFETAHAAMWKKVLVYEAKEQGKAAARTAKSGTVGGASPPGKAPAPAWLMRKMGRKGWGSGGCGEVLVDSVASAREAARPMSAHYVKSEAGWLGGPATKAAWGRHDWHLDFSKATPFMDMLAAHTALKSACSVRELNFFEGRCEFIGVKLDARALDDESLAIAAALEQQTIATAIAPKIVEEPDESPTARGSSGRRARI